MRRPSTSSFRIATAIVAILAFCAGTGIARADSLTLAWDRNAEPEVTGYVVYVGNAPGAYTQQFDVGNTTEYVLSVTPGQQYCFAVSAYVPGPIEGERSADVCATVGGPPANEPPTLGNPGDQTSALGAGVSLTLTATDPEGAPLTFSATGLPTGLTLGGASGTISGSPTVVGPFSVVATVSDGALTGSASFTWTITSSVPVAPTLRSPSGSTPTTTPSFDWDPVPTATRYRLWVDDNSDTNPRVQVDLTPAAAGCAAAGTVCRHNPGIALAAGPASWSVRATNSAGDGPWAGAMDFSIADGRAPVVTITTPTTNATHSTSATTIAIGGTAGDDVGVVQVTWSNDRGGAGTATGTSTWSVASVPLVQGANVITVTARDAENNTSTDRLTVTRTDGQQPTVEITLPTTSPSHRTTQTTIALGGTASDAFGVAEVRWSSSRGPSGVASGTTNWGVPEVALLAGSNVITVTARDAAGNSGSDTIAIDVVDGGAPTVTIVAPTMATTYSTTAATVTLSGTAADGFGVAAVTWANSRGGSGTATGTTGWTAASIALQLGENVITITARDSAGMTGTDTLTVTRTDGGSPTATITTPTSNSTHSTPLATIALGGTASDDVAVTEVTWSNDRGGSGTATGTTSWSVASVALQGGANTITVTARDASGRTGSDIIVVTRTDSDRPTVTITSPTGADSHSTTAATLTISGTAADAFGIAQITWTNSRGGGGTATGTTAWSAPGIALQPGSNVLTVTARDTSGNTATDTLTVTRTDSTAPTVTITIPTEAATHSTSNASVALGGRASDDFGVTEVRWASDKGASGVATGTASWTVASVALSAGANVITVTALDAAGQSATDTLTITRTDGDLPTVAITTPTSSPTHSVTTRTVALGGTARDSFGISRVDWSNDRGGSGVATGTTTWTVPSVGLQPGANVITITALDAAGKIGRATLTVTLTDGVAPEVRFVTPTTSPSFATTTPTIAIGGSATDDFGIARVTWANDRGGSGVASGTATWSAAGIALRAGTNVITVTATDAAGLSSSARLSVVATDSTRPSVSIVTPSPRTRFTTALASVAVGGTAADDFGLASVTWTSDRGTGGSASGTTAWSIASVALQPGVNNITVTATDQGGNTATEALRVVSDGRSPTVTISHPVASGTHAVNTATVNLGGAATDDQGVTEVSWSSNRGRRGVATGTTSWTATGVGLDAGINVLTVTARDEIGNTSSATLTVVLDTRAPGISIEAPTTSPSTSTNVGTIALRGTANDDVGVTQVTWANDRGGSGAATGATAWAIPSVALQAGVNVLTVTARDAAGNVSTDTLAVHFDTRAPVVTIAMPTAAATFATTSPGLALAGAATDDGVVTEVRWANSRGGSGVATGTSRWTVDRAALQPGANEITITARDAAGNSASTRLVVTATDRQAPTVRITGPAASDAFSTSARVINLDGTATDDFAVTQIAWASDRGASGVARGTGSWIAGGVALQPGLNVIAVTALDAAGNSSSDVLRITVDGQLPILNITSPAATTYNSTSPMVVVSGTASDDAGITQVLWASDRGPSGAALGTTTWTTPTIRLEPGANAIAVTARDGSGNSTTATLTVVYRDSTAPVVRIGTPTAGQTFTTLAPAINLSGTASDNVGVAQVGWSNDRGGSGIAFGTSGWAIAAIPLAVGVNVITVTARDADGLTGTAALRVTRSDGINRTPTTPNMPVASASIPDPAESASSPAAPSTSTTAASPATTAQFAVAPTGASAAPISDGSIPMAYQGASLPQPLAGAASKSASPAPTRTPVTAPAREMTNSSPAPRAVETPTQERPPARQPVVTIGAPSATDELLTHDEVVTLAGTSRDATVVTWSTNHGTSGTAIGRDRWSVPKFALPLGKTIVTVTARNGVGDLAADSLTITRQPTSAIQLDITSPTADSAWGTSSSTVALRGLASENVVKVTWQADWGGNGTASGTRTWSIPTIGLQIGVNRITVTAHDATGRTDTKVVSVSYRPQLASATAASPR